MQSILPLTAPPLLALVAPALVHGALGHTLKVGVYDPEGQCQHKSAITIEHLFISWATHRPDEVRRQLDAIALKGRHPLVTIEPWPDRTLTPISSTLLDDVADGKYDRRIQQVALEIAAFGNPVLLRWGHEMENVTGRYPWASKNAALYQEAYRHFVTTCRLWAKNIGYVWSPVGDKGLERYWPGGQYVDYIGLSVYEFPAFDRSIYHLAARSFHDQMTEKYERVVKYQKPIVISECGVTGTQAYQMSWLSDALQDLGNYPLLKALVYFNAKDTPGAWGREYATPDWRIGGGSFAEVVGASL